MLRELKTHFVIRHTQHMDTILLSTHKVRGVVPLRSQIVPYSNSSCCFIKVVVDPEAIQGMLATIREYVQLFLRVPFFIFLFPTTSFVNDLVV